MRGFQPQHFADGGLVQGVKRLFGMDAERNAQIAEYRARAAAEKAQQQAQAQQQTPQPQQRAVTQYSGMSATQRREKELGLADGGRVRPRGFVAGKGTATSDSIPARLSNGEYVLPADTVRAVGVEALDALRESTHKPVKGERAKAARGFFAGGTPGGLQKAYDDWQDKKTPWYMPTPRGNMEERTAEANYTDALKNHYSGQQSAPTLTSPAVTPAAPAQNQAAAPEPGAQRGMPEYKTDVQRGGGNVRANLPPSQPQPAITYTPPPRPAPAAAAPFDFDKFQPQSGEGAFRNEQTGEVTRLQDGPTPRGFRAWKEPNVVPRADAPQAPRQYVRAPVLNPNGGVFSSMVDFTNQAGQAVQAIAANKGMRNDRKDALDQQRVGLDAASTFAKIEQGDRALGIDGRRADTAQDLAALQAEELGLKREAQGFQTRAAKRLEDLQSSYQSAKTPEERASIAQQMRELQVKDAPARMQTVTLPDTTNEMGQVVRGGQALVRVLEDGTVQQVPIGAAPAPQAMPKPASKAEFDALPKGTRFTDPNGQVRIK